MKIEILTVDNINERCTGMTCFDAQEYIWKQIENRGHIYGIVIIDGETIKFSFSPYFRDGDIFSTNDNHRSIIRHLIPVWYAQKTKKENTGD